MNALSDRDWRDVVFGFSEAEMVAREEEETREKETTEFVDYLKEEYGIPHLGGIRGFRWLAMSAFVAVDHFERPEALRNAPATYQDKYAEFADRYGWPAVFGALSRAMREIEQERERLLTQG